MLSIQLSPDYEEKLEEIAKNQDTPKDEIVRQILRKFVDDYYRKPTAYELGKDLFGKCGSGRNDLSRTYKDRLKEKLHEKHSH